MATLLEVVNVTGHVCGPDGNLHAVLLIPGGNSSVLGGWVAYLRVTTRHIVVHACIKICLEWCMYMSNGDPSFSDVDVSRRPIEKPSHADLGCITVHQAGLRGCARLTGATVSLVMLDQYL